MVAKNTTVKMRDVARLAGVSTATVSRALAGNPLIAEETRSRIARIAEALNYRVHIGAKNLRLQQSQSIGLVIPIDRGSKQQVTDPFFLELMGSLIDALTESDFDVLVTRFDARRLEESQTLIQTGRAIGLIIIGQWRAHDQLNQMAASGVPLMVWGAAVEGQKYCTVGSDNRLGGRLAAQHLLSLGCQRTLFLGDASLYEVAHRREGFLEEVEPRHSANHERYYLPVPFAPDLAKLEMMRWLDQLPGRFTDHFDSVFAASDLLAITLIQLLASRGISVPNDIRCVGFDDIQVARHINPSLSTIHQSIDLAGQEIALGLSRLISGDRTPVALALPTHLKVRASTGTEPIRHG
ncbi:MAG: hypothetical protein RLY30_1639 [Pseudomonadota bacterium]|jgi:DNA-binding LacI/PurR family transcriptional regulator